LTAEEREVFLRGLRRAKRAEKIGSHA
jgi:hypothetical protein